MKQMDSVKCPPAGGPERMVRFIMESRKQEEGPLLLESERLEPLSRRAGVIVGPGFSFSTDTVLLAAFSMPSPGEKCAELGTGCGVIPLLWCLRAKPAKIWAAEIQPEACSMARRSVSYNRMEDRVSIVEGDLKLLAASGKVPRDLDLVASNPPYKEDGTGIKSGDERLRIARHEVACGFADIAGAAASLLRWGGRFCCCMRPERLCDTLFVSRNAGLEPKRIRFVQQRKNKAPFLFLLQAAKGGKPGLAVEPVLFLEAEDGGASEEMKAIYGDYREGSPKFGKEIDRTGRIGQAVRRRKDGCGNER